MPEILKNRYLVGIGILCILTLTFWISQRISWHNGIHKLSYNNQQQLEQFVGHFESQLSRYQFIPQLVAKNFLLVELLNDPTN
ncbi:MAG: hypothetical protein AB2805_19265, partial [Candidatus Thiodiazotropha sp.]